jgi:predicted 3-demethylubiquinone-9 3-methyltransferase (glyoxalase superfamily)
MQKITPFLWFDSQAEEAAKFYVSIFKDSKIVGTTHYGEAGPGPKGSVLTVKFQIAGQEFIALNGGPMFKFNESVSFVVNCETQEEIDYFWEKLTAGGGEESRCGWLSDKFGLSWQVVPALLQEMMLDKDEAKSNRVMEAILKMDKLDLATLERAYEGK